MNLRLNWVAGFAVAAIGFAAEARDYTSEISEGAIAFGNISEDSTITIASGTTVMSSTEITGSGNLSISGTGTLVFSGISPDYSGEISIAGTIVKIAAKNALGTGKVMLNGSSAQLRFVTGSFGETYVNDIAVNNSSVGLYFDGITSAVTFDGTLTVDDETKIYASWDTAKAMTVANFNKAITAGTVSFESNQKNSYAYFHLKGIVRARSLYALGASNSSSLPIVYLYSTENVIGALYQRYKGGFKAKAANCMGGAARIIYESIRNGIQLDGYSQTSAYVSVTAANKDRCSLSTSSAARLTLTGGVESATCTTYLGLEGALSLVIDDQGEEGIFTQIFNGDDGTLMSMSGSIEVKRGNLAFAGSYLLNEVPSISVDNGSFSLQNTNETVKALGGLKSLTIGAQGIVTIDSAINPFSDDSTLDLSVVDGAVLNLPTGVTELNVGYFSVNGTVQKIGRYTHSKCSVVPEGVTIVANKAPAEITEEITWMGGASDDSFVRAANWGLTGSDLDFSGDKYLATFAQAGATATVFGEALFHGLVFSGSDFTLRRSESDDEIYVYSAGIAFTDDLTSNPNKHKYTIEPNLVFTSSMEVSIPKNDVLSLMGGLESPVDLVFNGAGRLEIGGVSDLSGKLTMSSGPLFCIGTVGNPENSSGKIELTNGNQLICSNATVNCEVSMSLVNGNLKFSGVETNYVTKAISGGGRSYTLSTDWNSTVVLEGGASNGLKTWIAGKGVVIVRKTPVTLGVSTSNPLTTASGGGTLVLQVANNVIGWVKPNSGVLNIRTEDDYALNGENGVVEYVLQSTDSLDLTATRQKVIGLSASSGSVVKGTAGATLELAPTAGTRTELLNKMEGGVSLSVGGAADAVVVLTGQAYASSGDLTVTNGTLELAASATWLKGRNFSVKGAGVLRFANDCQIDKGMAALHVSEQGKVYVPSGVTLWVSSMDLDGGTPVGVGVYSAASAGFENRIVGGGAIRVGKRGVVLFVK